MSGTWPQLDVQDFTLRSRHYLNELIAKFYQDAELWRYMSQSAREIAQRGSGIRYILENITFASTRTVAHNAYRCHHVEYVPSSGRTEMLEKIDPLQVGHKTYDGSTPQYWYEDGSNIGLDPLPDNNYKIRMYVSSFPNILYLSFSSFTIGTGTTQWTQVSGTGWTGGSSAVHSGTPSGLQYNTSLPSGNYILRYTVSDIGVASSISLIGSFLIYPINANGFHTVTVTGSGAFILWGVGSITIDDLYIYKEADFSSLTDLSDLSPMWNHTLVLMTLMQALQRDNRTVMSKVLSILTAGEIDYLRSNLIEVIPDSKATRWGER